MADKIMLLDGHSLLNRAFYGLPDLTNAEGKHTNAVLGFLNIMLRYVEEEKPTHLLVAFDRKEPTFRHIKYKEYKGTRKPMPAELHEQVPLMKEVLKTMEIPIITQAGIEWCIHQPKELKAAGVPCLHYYTMGDVATIRKIAESVY